MAPEKALLTTGDEDRLSSLQDDVICHILSYLPTKDSVRTSILSTRWKHLFTFVPILEFIYPSFIDTPPPSPSRSSTNFKNFVNSVFVLYKVLCMRKFRLHFWDDEESDQEDFLIIPWISDVIHRHIQEIDIRFGLSTPKTIPGDIFSCKTLTSLTLEGECNLVLPRSACLPCLRFCHFRSISFDDDSARGFFRSCPVLESLYLIVCHVGDGVQVLDISVPTLKRLYLYSWEGYRIFVNVPNLTYLEYMGTASHVFDGLESLKSGVEAIINYSMGSRERDHVIVKVVRAISTHASTIYLSSDTMEAFIRGGHLLPTFEHLKKLEIGPISGVSSWLLPVLLQNSPKLEYFSFYQRYEYGTDGVDLNGFILPEHVPTCVSQQLKEVIFDFTIGFDYSHKLLKYLLKHAKNLKKMIIRSNLSWNEVFEIGSTDCQIVFISDEKV